MNVQEWIIHLAAGRALGILPCMEALLRQAHKALCDDDVDGMRRIFAAHPELKARINDPVSHFDSPPLFAVRSREMLDLFLEAGAEINAKSRWWAGGFGFLHLADRRLALYAIERGAEVDIHAAARLGLADRVRALIESEPALVHARGGDGQTPLHFASTVPIAEYLLNNGADIDARDVDHESTPAQYMIDDRQEVVRFLIERGCGTDIFMAAALGDLPLARQHLEANPDSIRMRVSQKWFPMSSARAGGTIYQWKLGWHVSPHAVAKKFGHAELVDYLMRESPLDVKLLEAAWAGNASEVESITAQHPGIVRSLAGGELSQIADAARNNNLFAVRLFLEAGFPLDARGQHQATALHWAAWHGNAEMVRAILRQSPDLENADNEFHGTPLQWAIHGSENGWHKENGNYRATVEALLVAGAKPPAEPGGTREVREILRAYGVS